MMTLRKVELQIIITSCHLRKVDKLKTSTILGIVTACAKKLLGAGAVKICFSSSQPKHDE